MAKNQATRVAEPGQGTFHFQRLRQRRSARPSCWRGLLRFQRCDQLGFSIRHWKGRNSASFLKSRALTVITVIPKQPALIAISASLVKRPFPICS